MATIANIAIGLTARTQSFDRGMKRSGRNAETFGRRVKRVAAGVARLGIAMTAIAGAAFLRFAKQTIDTGDNLNKMADRTGLAVKFLAGLSFAAKIGGTDLATMEKAVRKLQGSALDASRGLLTYTQEFDALGVSVVDTSGNLKDTEKLFLEVADALSKLENKTLKSAIASKLLGRSGTALLPSFKEGAKGINALVKESEQLGNVWNDLSAKQAADLNDSITRLSASFENKLSRTVLDAVEALGGAEATIARLTVAFEVIALPVRLFGGFIRELSEDFRLAAIDFQRLGNVLSLSKFRSVAGAAADIRLLGERRQITAARGRRQEERARLGTPLEQAAQAAAAAGLRAGTKPPTEDEQKKTNDLLQELVTQGSRFAPGIATAG